MERFMNTELADMHLIYGLAKRNVRAAEKLYHERYSEGSLRVTQTTSMEQSELDTVRRNLSTKILSVAAAMDR
ncbi:hypothetical protein TNCV_4189341 [Trichonephila clavipes]|nr:hypothetical protein TNCV_4189341 [Trichonephila clavipes]